MLAAVHRAKKDTRLLPLRDGQPKIKFHHHPLYVRATWQEWKRTGRFADETGDPLDINIALRNDVYMYDRAYKFEEAVERHKAMIGDDTDDD